MRRHALALAALLAGCTEQVPACADPTLRFDGTRCVAVGDGGLDAGPSPLDAGHDAGADAGVDAGCPAGEEACGGACVDVSTSAEHCGTCNTPCAAPRACRARACVDDPVEVSTAPTHTCVRRASGRVACWGSNQHGQLGDGSLEDRLSPVAVEGVTDAAAISVVGVVGATRAGNGCLRRRGGQVLCWGYNERGRLGVEAPGDQPAPAAVITSGGAPLAGAARVGAGWTYACATVNDAATRLLCWGLFGTFRAPAPITAVPTAGEIVELAVGVEHACVVAADRRAYCWGTNTRGQLGDGTTTPRPTSAAAVRQGGVELGGLSGVAVTETSACAWRTSGVVACWGDRERLGVEPPIDDALDAQDVPTLTDVTGLFAGQYASATCATRSSTDEVVCWGIDIVRSVRDGAVRLAYTPTAVVGIEGASQLSVATSHACALVGPEVRCWGRNDFGQLGDGTRDPRADPVSVVLPP
ncbi:MAG: hypothetical protein KF729_37090 [Sandaracinaceae bacterium]|nr:hypothetical protein [Sandaracinaceae bacterium]